MTFTIDGIGTKPKNAIFLPNQPYQVRFNCQSGQLALSETEFLGNSAEISILKVARFFGTLGKTRNTEWLQLFFIPAPDCKILPTDTVCVSYIKTRSLGQFNQTMVRLLGDGSNPADGIFCINFIAHSNDKGNYFSVSWKWRQRKEGEEQEQLKRIAAFLKGKPQLIDLGSTANLISCESLTALEIEEMRMLARDLPAANPLELLEAVRTVPAIAPAK